MNKQKNLENCNSSEPVKVSFSGLIFTGKVIEPKHRDTNPYRDMTDEEYEEYENYIDGLAGDWEG